MSNVRQNTSNFDPLRNWEENGTALQPVTAGYNLGTSGNEVGDLLMTGSLGIGATAPTAALQVIGDTHAGAGNTGANCNFVGSGAGTGNSGAHCSAFGYRSLYSSSSGSGNLASGYQALYSNTSGSYNVASGYQCLYNNLTGKYNTASGYQSLFNNTEGDYNVASGYENLRSNLSGDHNISSGYQSLYSNTSGLFNLGMGYQSLYSTTTGSSNLGFGYRSGRYIADGTTANVTSGTSIYLGGNTRALANGGANEIVIGDTAIGLGSNTAVLGNSSIATTRLQGSVGIGRDVPAEALHVQLNVRANGRFLASQGTAASPSYGFSDDGDIGLFRLTTNTLGISTTGVTRLAIGPTGNVGIGTDTPDANALLDITSTTKAFLPPRMTTTQKGAVASPTAGMVVYDSTLSKLAVYTGAAWEAITSA